MIERTRATFLTILLVAFVQLSCDESVLAPTEEPGNQSNERISITNDESVLATRITILDQEVAIDTSGSGSLPKRAQPQAFSLKLVAEVRPPSAGGQVLQATSIAMKGEKAIVSYNMRGPQYLGAIDVVDIQNKYNPRLTSEAIFDNADINSVSFDEGYVYVAEATGDGGFPYPAVLEVIKLIGSKLVLEENQRVPLTSYAGTGVVVSDKTVYATSGDNGGMSVFSQSDLNLNAAFDLHDARWVDVEDEKVIVVQGTPGRIAVFDAVGLSPLSTYSFTGADIPESKSTVELVGGKAFIAGGTGGVQILSVNTGAIVGTVPRPDPDSVGLDPSVVVTNAASVDEDLLFISNGEAGVYVAQASQRFRETGSEEPQQLTLLGKLQFDELQSVNHVVYRARYLMIAAGLGGLKIVKIELK